MPHLTPIERKALELVRDKLRSGEIPAAEFDMHYFNCGTTHCIGGWAWALSDDLRSDYRRRRLSSSDFYALPTHGLFLPSQDRFFHATPIQAAQARDNFLAIGDPKWAEILETPK